jgi:hypothetical protein
MASALRSHRGPFTHFKGNCGLLTPIDPFSALFYGGVDAVVRVAQVIGAELCYKQMFLKT